MKTTEETVGDYKVISWNPPFETHTWTPILDDMEYQLPVKERLK